MVDGFMNNSILVKKAVSFVLVSRIQKGLDLLLKAYVDLLSKSKAIEESQLIIAGSGMRYEFGAIIGYVTAHPILQEKVQFVGR
jgi:glycogen synthase